MGEQIVLNKGPTISTKEKKRTEEAKLKGPAVSHQRWGEYVNVFFGSTSKIILLFCSFWPISCSFTDHGSILPQNWGVYKSGPLFPAKFWSIRAEWQINSAVTYQRKGGPNCFEQGEYINKDHSFQESSDQ